MARGDEGGRGRQIADIAVNQAVLVQAAEGVKPAGIGGRLRFGRIAPVAVVRLVVDDHYRAGIRPQDAGDDLRRRLNLRLQAGQILDPAHRLIVGKEQPGKVLRQKLMIVDGLKMNVAQIVQVSVGRQVEVGVEIFGKFVGHAVLDVPQTAFQPFPHGDAGRDGQETVGKTGVGGVGAVVGGLPEHQGGHHRRLAGAGSHLVADAGNAVIAGGVDAIQLGNDGVPGSIIRRNFGEPDGSEDGLLLGKVKPLVGMDFRPVADEVAGNAGNAGVAGLLPPRDGGADVVDHFQEIGIAGPGGQHGGTVPQFNAGDGGQAAVGGQTPRFRPVGADDILPAAARPMAGRRLPGPVDDGVGGGGH